ncbi:MAG: hypothetical protein ACPGUY_04685, partial [Akkermansiaceae bacterium]
MKKYIHSEEFRIFMGETVGNAMGADAHFSKFEWQGMQASTDSFHAEGDGALKFLRAEGIRATVELGEVKNKIWKISGVRVSNLDLHINTSTEDSGTPAPAAGKPDEPAAAASDEEPGFLAGLLPDKAVLDSADVSRLNLDLKTTNGFLKADNMVALITTSTAVKGAYDVKLSEGLVRTSWFGSPLDLKSARGRYADGRIFINAAEAKVYKRGQLTLEGEIEGDDFGFYGTLKDVRSEELVPANWQKRITGDLSTEFKVQSARDGTILRGNLKLKRGVLTALPILDRIAAYSNTRRFRRLDLSEATMKFRKQGDRLDLTEIVIASEGLIRVEGQITVVGDHLDGRFRVGITPGTLAHIPGAETKVFVRGERGLLWSPLRITGTIDAPKEDLSNRMIAAAGERMFELVPETGKMALKFAHDTATELPSKAVETGQDVLDEGTGIIGDGIQGVFD